MSDLTEYHIKLIKRGLRAAEEGKFVSHAEMKKLIAKMTRRKRGSSRKVLKALKIQAPAGKKSRLDLRQDQVRFDRLHSRL